MMFRFRQRRVAMAHDLARSTHLRRQALQLSGARAGIGIASIFAPKLSGTLAGYPADQNTPTASLMARMFGIRELLLAWLVVDAFRSPAAPPPSVFMAQAAVDIADIAVQGLPLLRREGLDRAALGGIALAAGAAVMWIRLAQAARSA